MIRFLQTLAANVVIAALSLITGTLTARLLGPHGRGELAAIQNIPTSLASIGLLGIPGAAAYYTARAPGNARSIHLTATLVSVGLAVITTAVGFFVIPYALGHQSPEAVHFARIYLLFLPLQALQYPSYTVLQGLHRFSQWNSLRLLPYVTWLIALLLCWATREAVPGPLSVTYLVLYGAAALPAMVTFWRHTSGHPRLDSGLAKELVRFGAPSGFATVPGLVNLRLDQILMAAVLPSEALGYYVTAVAWSAASGPLFNAVGSVMFPALARASPAEARDVALRVFRSSLVAAVVVTGAILAITPVGFAFLFGPEFRQGLSAALVLVVAGGIAGVITVTEDMLRGLGAPRWPLYGQLAGVPVTLLCLMLLLQPFGPLGAAIASLAAYSMTGAVLCCAMHALLRARWTELFPTTSDVRHLVASAATLFVRQPPLIP